jgi:hypothetical protein
MASERSPIPVMGFSPAPRIAHAFFTGAGAAAVVLTPAATIPLIHNMAAPVGARNVVITRNGVGDHTLVLPRRFYRTLFVDPRVTGTTALQATVTTLTDNADNTLTVRVLTATPAGVATDLAATDVLRLKVEGSDSTGDR